MDHGIGDYRLGGDEGGESVEIDRVNAAVDDEIADNAEEYEDVYASVEKWWRQDAGWKATEACGSEGAGSDEQQAAVILGLGTPIDAEDERDGEAHHVEQRNDEERIRPRLVKLERVETGHGDGGSDAHEGDGDAEGYPEPTSLLVDANVAGAHEQGLKNVKDEPASENERVEIKDGGARRRGMDEVFVYRVAETVHDGRGDDERHEEIEIIVERSGGSGNGFWERAGCNVYWL